MSPPSRAAWIEIAYLALAADKILSRRLHGRRGLKYYDSMKEAEKDGVAAFTGGVD